MRILVLDVPKEGVTFNDYLPHLEAETRQAWAGVKSDVVREIYFRQERPGLVIILAADSVDAARDVMSQMPLKKAGLLDFEYIPFANYTFWENLFAPEHKEGGK